MPRAILLALSLGAALRLGAALAWRGQPLLEGGDDAQYLVMAHALAEGRGLEYQGPGAGPPGPTAYRMPLYPMFLAAGLTAGRPFGAGLGSLRLLLALWSVLGLWLAYRLARELGGEGAGLAAAWICALHPEVVLLPTSLYLECFYSVPVLGAAWALVRWRKAPGPRRAALLGAAVGLSLLARSTLALIPLLAALGRWSETRSRRGLREAGVLLLFAFLPLAPWVLRNAVVFGRFIPLEAGLAGPVLLHAAEGHVRAPPSQEREPSLANMYARLPHTEWDRFAAERAWTLILQRPDRYLRGCLRRATYLWTDSYVAYLVWYHGRAAAWMEAGRHWDAVRWGERLLRLALVLLAGAALLGGAGRPGAMAPGRGRPAPGQGAFALAGLLAYFSLYALGAVFIRFMAPATPLLCALGGLGWAKLRAKNPAA